MKRIAFISSLALLFTIAAAGQYDAPPANAKPAQPAPSGAAQTSSQDPSVKKARDLIDKMIQALGGQAYLNIQDMEQSGRTYGFSHGEPAGAGALYWSFWKWPDKERIELTKQRDVVTIFNGDNGYDVTFRGTTWAEKPLVEDYLRRRHYSMQKVLRDWLKEPGVAYFYEGFSSAERKPAEKVTIMNAKNEAVTFYIDTTSFLPIKKSFLWRDPTYGDKTQEDEIFDNYRLVQGIMTPFSVTRKKNDWATNQRFIFEVKYNQNLSDSMFDAKVGQANPKRK